MKDQIERAATALAVFIGAAASLFIASSISGIKEKEPDNATDDVNGLIFLAFFIAIIGYAHGYAILTYTAITNRNEVDLRAVDRFLFCWGYFLSSGSFLVVAMVRLMFGKVLRSHHSFAWAIAGSAVIGVTRLKFGCSFSFQPPGSPQPVDRRRVSGKSHDSGEGLKGLQPSNKPAPWVKENREPGSSHRFQK
ncbi:hypothetical protein B0T26DRAFT_874969 [Lasiosphaeria miniovina]|uniref:Uncharacterized protein n=1 Tax=Lasiosphaeria miniovina TaxID=1954250 RepID=A0AA40A699_9PEZI|nr:uncharacterized protein B0T26DRAFT_874969 [Lasiosphaeria miniovina]KAK0710039.1 hypothetical protein B0T26DRAFT_874969 [Lasiosphaeria miniovina]